MHEPSKTGKHIVSKEEYVVNTGKKATALRWTKIRTTAQAPTARR